MRPLSYAIRLLRSTIYFGEEKVHHFSEIDSL